MPHSPGVYLALVLKNACDIEEQYLTEKDLNLTVESLKKSESGSGVRRLIIKNNLFLDVDSLSKNLQTILRNYQMIVIAKIKGMKKLLAEDEFNPYGLEP